MIHVEEATHPRSSKNHVKMLMFPSFSSRHGFLFDLLAPWLPSSSGVIARSASSARLGWSQGGFVVSEVSWIVRLEESSELRGELFDVVFPLDFGRADLVLEA